MTSKLFNLPATWLRFAVLAIFFCSLALAPLVQGTAQVRVVADRNQSPVQEERQGAEEELATSSELVQRLKQRKHARLLRPANVAVKAPQQRHASRLPLAVDGHRLANGICAPLLT